MQPTTGASATTVAATGPLEAEGSGDGGDDHVEVDVNALEFSDPSDLDELVASGHFVLGAPTADSAGRIDAGAVNAFFTAARGDDPYVNFWMAVVAAVTSDMVVDAGDSVAQSGYTYIQTGITDLAEDQRRSLAATAVTLVRALETGEGRVAFPGLFPPAERGDLNVFGRDLVVLAQSAAAARAGEGAEGFVVYTTSSGDGIYSRPVAAVVAFDATGAPTGVDVVLT